MGQLIAFRALQGLGGGGLMVTTIAVIGDIVAPRERGRYQGYTSSALALATVAGPLLGGFFVDSLSWRWIFYVNLPLGLVAFLVIGVVFTTRTATVRHRIDYGGAVLLSAALSSIVLYTSLGGQTIPWLSWEGGLLVAAALVAATDGSSASSGGRRSRCCRSHLFRIRTIAVGSGARLRRGLRALRCRHVPPLLPPGREGREPDGVGPADGLADGRAARDVHRRRPADQQARPLSGLPDRRARR